MFDFIKKNQLKISLILTLITLLFILLSQTETSKIKNWLSSVTFSIAYPFQATAHYFSSHVSDAWQHYVWLIDTKRENTALKKIIQELKQKNDQYYEVGLAYERIRRSLEFKKSNRDKKIFAEVIAEAGEGLSKQLIINKGAQDGIKPNYAVLVPEGIVGKIAMVTPFQSTVQLITDGNSQFPVLIQRTRTKGILSGSIEGNPYITFIPRRLDIVKGDRIVASGLAGIFPKGFLVGTVKHIEKKNYGLFQSALIVPSVDFNKIEEVFVILKSRDNIQMPLFTE